MYYLVHAKMLEGWLGILATETDLGKAWFMKLVHVFEES